MINYKYIGSRMQNTASFLTLYQHTVPACEEININFISMKADLILFLYEQAICRVQFSTPTWRSGFVDLIYIFSTVYYFLTAHN